MYLYINKISFGTNTPSASSIPYFRSSPIHRVETKRNAHSPSPVASGMPRCPMSSKGNQNRNLLLDFQENFYPPDKRKDVNDAPPLLLLPSSSFCLECGCDAWGYSNHLATLRQRQRHLKSLSHRITNSICLFCETINPIFNWAITILTTHHLFFTIHYGVDIL